MDLLSDADICAGPATCSPSAHARITRRSLLAAPPEEVWERIVSVRWINAELMPIVRMTFPPDRLRVDALEPAHGQPVFRSVLLLFGVLPIDVHTCTVFDLSPGRGFVEQSSSLVQRVWLHQRRLQAVPGGTELTDQIEYACRLPGLAAMLRPALAGVFGHRHRQLRRHFGALAPGRTG